MGLLAGCGPAADPKTPDESNEEPAFDASKRSPTLIVKKVDKMPSIDGDLSDEVWNEATGITTATTTLKAVYTDDEIAFQFTGVSPKLSIMSMDAWYYDGNEFISWRDHLAAEGIEQGIVNDFTDMYNMGWELKNIGILDGGCEALCHVGEDGVEFHVVPDGAKADYWTLLSKHGFGPNFNNEDGWPLGIFGVSQGAGPVVFDKSEPGNPFNVTQGTFTWIGWADERIQTSLGDPDYVGSAMKTETGEYCLNCHTVEDTEKRPLQGKSGTMPYTRNTLGYENMYMTAPKYIKPNPENWADAMVITKDEISAGKAVEIASLSKAELEQAWAKYDALNCLVPELILQEPSGNMAQVKVGAKWSDGVWTIELKRDRVTGNPDDVQFDDINKEYPMQSAGLNLDSAIGVRVVLENPLSF